MTRTCRPLTEEEKAKVRQWHHQGVSFGEIGRRLHRTKNSIVGHVHRLELPSRGSPIIRRAHRPNESGPNRNGYPLAAGKASLPALSSLSDTPDPEVTQQNPMKWSESQDELLRELAPQNLTWGEIGKHFGVSGSSVKHRAARIGLPPRDGRDFIRRGAGNAGNVGPREVDEVRNTLPVLASQSPTPDQDDNAIRDIVDAFAAVRPVRSKKELKTEKSGCRYPLWEMWDRPTHEFCNAACYRGQSSKSWCFKHYNIVFAKVSFRGDAA